MRPIHYISFVLLFVNFNLGNTFPSESYRFTERKVDAFWNDEDSWDGKMNVVFKNNHDLRKYIRSPVEDLAPYNGEMDSAKMLLKHHKIVGFRCGNMNGMEKCNERQEGQGEGQEGDQEESHEGDQEDSQDDSHEGNQDGGEGGGSDNGGSEGGSTQGENSQEGDKRLQHEGLRCGGMNGMGRCNEGGQEGGEGRGQGEGRGSGGSSQGDPSRGQDTQGRSGRLQYKGLRCGGMNGMARCNGGGGGGQEGRGGTSQGGQNQEENSQN